MQDGKLRTGGLQASVLSCHHSCGDTPTKSIASTDAPTDSRCATVCKWPLCAARMSGVSFIWHEQAAACQKVACKGDRMQPLSMEESTLLQEVLESSLQSMTAMIFSRLECAMSQSVQGIPAGRSDPPRCAAPNLHPHPAGASPPTGGHFLLPAAAEGRRNDRSRRVALPQGRVPSPWKHKHAKAA
eukprot:365327-Chlamydomonas_euryale.AAC.4